MQCVCDQTNPQLPYFTKLERFHWTLEHMWWKHLLKNKSQRDPRSQPRGISLAWDLLIAVFTLHYLAGHYGCVEALVTWGADVDMDIPHMGTALYTACVCQELECARTLLREGQPVAVLICTSMHTRLMLVHVSNAPNIYQDTSTTYNLLESSISKNLWNNANRFWFVLFTAHKRLSLELTSAMCK